ncbi:hypothetical protein ASZ90_015776 [hydrocarbon metagenome]|uniref:Uncharacterized protein n=1 Tax=hydrocarbon metagenome TaxID=938273 RepID=A0A0W8F110_9ZZZZ
MISWAFRRLQDARACTSAGDRFRTATGDDALHPLVPGVRLPPGPFRRGR